MSRQNVPTPENSAQFEKQPCTVCGQEFQNSPNHVVKIVGPEEKSILQIELGVRVVMPPGSEQPPQYAPAPICIPCVNMIVGNAFWALRVKAAAPKIKPEQN